MMVSVVMPVYNSALYLADSIGSILNQSFSDFEFLIINDGSTDNSAAIINSFQDARIRFFNFENNAGYTNRLNFGLQEAKGEFIARLDSDDISLPNRLERQLAVLEDNPDILVCGANIELFGTGWIDHNWVITGEPDLVKVSLLINNPVCHPSVMIRASALRQYNIQYQPQFEPCEDYKMWVDLSQKGKLFNLDEVLLRYRTHDTQVSKTRTLEQRKARDFILKEQLALLGITPTNQELALHDSLETPARLTLLPEYLPGLKNWLDKIKKANKVMGVYKQEILESYLNQHYAQKIVVFREKYAALTLFQKIKFQVKKYIAG